MQVKLNFPDKKAPFLLDVLRNIKYVTVELIAEPPAQKPSKKTKVKISEKAKSTIKRIAKSKKQAKFLEGLCEALEEVKLCEEGKIELRPARELVKELRSYKAKLSRKKNKAAA